MPQSRTHTGAHPRRCKETGTVIMGLIPWQVTKPKPPGILQTHQGKEETGKQEIPAMQADRRIRWRRKSVAASPRRRGCPGCAPTGSSHGCSTRMRGDRRASSRTARSPRPVGRAAPLLSPRRGYAALWASKRPQKGLFKQMLPGCNASTVRGLPQTRAGCCPLQAQLRFTHRSYRRERSLIGGAYTARRLPHARGVLISGDVWAQDKGGHGHKA